MLGSGMSIDLVQSLALDSREDPWLYPDKGMAGDTESEAAGDFKLHCASGQI